MKLGWRRKPLETPEPTFEPGAWADLAWDARQDISYDGILRCYEEAKDLLGGYPIDLVSVHDPDEYLAAFPSRRKDVLGAYRALFELKAAGEVKGVGIGSKDWTVIRDLARDVPFDWAMFACAPPAAGCCPKNAWARWRRRSTGFRAIPRLGMPP